MAISYPTSLDTTTTFPSDIDGAERSNALGTANVGLDDLLNDLGAAVRALQGEVGVTNSAVTTSVRYILARLFARDYYVGPGGYDTVQDAIDAADAAYDADGTRGMVFVSGQYEEAITLKQGVSIYNGFPGYSRITLPDGANTATVKSEGFSTANALLGIHHFTWQNIDVDGNAANQTGNSDSGTFAIYGYAYVLERFRLDDAFGVGLYTTWGDGSPADGGPMESRYIDIEIDGAGGDGWYHNGPHDSIARGVIVSNGGERGIYAGTRGNALQATACHVWGNSHTLAWEIDGTSCRLTNCEGEGASTQQMKISANDCVVLGGHYWAAGGAAKGIEINGASGCLLDTKVSNCTDWAIKYTSDPGGNVVRLLVYGASGAIQSGTPHDSTHTEYTVSGSQTGQHHYRMLLAFWGQETIADSQSGVALAVNESAVRTAIPMMQPGSITGIEARMGGWVDAGSLTVEVTKNGTGVGLATTISSPNSHNATKQGPNVDSFTFGDLIGVAITTDGTFAPGGSDYVTVIVEVAV